MYSGRPIMIMKSMDSKGLCSCESKLFWGMNCARMPESISPIMRGWAISRGRVMNPCLSACMVRC